MGEDPEYGASLNYWLSEPAGSTPTLTILDENGNEVRTLRGPNQAGVNRVHWDLRDEPNGPIRLLTSPTYAEHIRVGPEGRNAPGSSQISILMPPGQYTVKLTVDGQEHVQPLTVLKDPNSAGTEADIAEQVALLQAVREDVVAAGEAIHRIEAVRVQLMTLARFNEDEEVAVAVRALEQKLVEHEMELVDLRLTGQGQDGVRFGAKLLQKLTYLPGGLAGSDFRPTDQQVEVQGLLHAELQESMRELDAIFQADLAALNDLLRQKGMIIITDAG
jgi:hypothetical protein